MVINYYYLPCKMINYITPFNIKPPSEKDN